MLTGRGWSFLLIVLLMLAFGIVGRLAALTILCLTLLVWFAAEFVVFAMRAHSLHRRLRVRHEISDERGPVNTLWAGREFEVRVSIWGRGVLGLPHVSAVDRVPYGVELLSGPTR